MGNKTLLVALGAGGRVGVGRGGFELLASNQPKALHLIGLDFWVWGRGGGG